jgi:SRSO17 transposase
MRVPMKCLDVHFANFLGRYRRSFSKPQYEYFVTILLGLVLCQSGCTLSGVLRQVENGVSLSGTSRFLAQSPWTTHGLSETWQKHFGEAMVSAVEAEHARQRARRRKQRGRPRRTLVTGYLIGDDTVMQKQRGQKMSGLGKHFSSTHEKPVTGHCMVQALYVLLGRRCPLEPQMYRQQAVCEQEGIAFRSKVEIMCDILRNFTPVANTQTHVLLDSWYTAQRVWKAARQRDFLITSGLRSNRQVRIADESHKQGWRWQRLDEYARQVTTPAFTPLVWPNSERTVYVHVVSTRIKKLYCCQLICVREQLDGPTRFWASSDLEADPQTLLAHIAQRWDIEQLFADVKELLGLDHYQLMSATAIQRFWTLVMLAYLFLDEERFRLQQRQPGSITIGDACRHVQRTHCSHLLDWLFHAFTERQLCPADLHATLLA